jgi:hypothetical protein
VNAWCAPQGVGLAHAPNQIANLRRHLRSSRAAPRFRGPIPGEGSPLPTDDRIGLNHLQARAPTRPQSRQQNPAIGRSALGADARCVVVENGQLVAKGENPHLQGGTGPKTGGDQSEKSDNKKAHRGCHHDPTNDRNLCVFRSDGVFGQHSSPSRVQLKVRVRFRSAELQGS